MSELGPSAKVAIEFIATFFEDIGELLGAVDAGVAKEFLEPIHGNGCYWQGSKSIDYPAYWVPSLDSPDLRIFSGSQRHMGTPGNGFFRHLPYAQVQSSAGCHMGGCGTNRTKKHLGTNHQGDQCEGAT